MTDMEGTFFFAAAFADQVKEATQGSNLETRNILIGCTVVLLIGFAIFAWVYLRARKKSDAQDKERISQMARSITPAGSNSSSSSGSNSSNTSGPRQRRRKRRRRREHRPRNPSLEKTGGLPPPRPEDQLPKY